MVLCSATRIVACSYYLTPEKTHLALVLRLSIRDAPLVFDLYPNFQKLQLQSPIHYFCLGLVTVQDSFIVLFS